jgi:hypothetical protein
MKTILAKSGFVAIELARMSNDPDVAIFKPESGGDRDACEWLTSNLSRNRVSVVFFDTAFFVDSSRFRAISPATRFVALAGDGDEADAERALVNGACAILGKPMCERDVSGVLSLVAE